MAFIKSPIYYTGNKYRLLSELQQFIPDRINTFIDVFGGSGVMAINFSLVGQLGCYLSHYLLIKSFWFWFLKLR